MYRRIVVISREGLARVIFFFKQKTAYEMRSSDWSSDVCSSDLIECRLGREGSGGVAAQDQRRHAAQRLGAVQPGHFRNAAGEWRAEIGRASCRERVCQYV